MASSSAIPTCFAGTHSPDAIWANLVYIIQLGPQKSRYKDGRERSIGG